VADKEEMPNSWPSPFDSENYTDASRDLLERAKLVAETEKAHAEALKLQRENRLGHWTFLIEPARNLLPAISIFSSVLIGVWTLNAQLEKDAAERRRDHDTLIVGRLAEYEKTMISGSVTSGSQDYAPRTAILTLRSLGAEAVPILIADIQLGPKANLATTIKGVILEMNEDSSLRPKISESLLHAIKYTLIRDLANDRIDLPLVEEYVDLFINTHHSNRQADPTVAALEVSNLTSVTNDIQEMATHLPPVNNETQEIKRAALLKDIHTQLDKLLVKCK
jgi:hypothetical protein